MEGKVEYKKSCIWGGLLKETMIELLNIDCLEYMKGCACKSFDLAIVDPQTGQGEGKKHITRPYTVKQDNGNSLSVKRTHHISEWDSAPPTQEYFDELFRVSKHQIIMCENYLHFNQNHLLQVE